MLSSHSSCRHPIGGKIIVACALGSLLWPPSFFLIFGGNPVRAQDDRSYTFEALHPEFLKTRIPDYAQFEAAKSPATYEPENGDFRAEFVSPNGTPVSIVVKAPLTSGEYDVPPRSPNQTVYDYLNGALYDANNQPRSKTIIKLPKDTYNFDFPLYSNCTSTTDFQPKYVHWQLPQGASDLVIDGQGSTVNFSDFCLGLVLPAVQRVMFKNFTFAWPKITIASLGTVTAIGGNGTTGYTYDVNIASPLPAPLPKMIAATTSWDKDAGHWNLRAEYDDVSYGDGISSGVPFSCAGTPAGAGNGGCTLKSIPSYGVQFKVGETVVLRFYDYAPAISVSGNDVTLDHVTLTNLIGSDFSYSQGRGLHVTHLALTRMEGRPVSAGGGGSLITNVGGDVVIEDSSLAYQSDDAFDMNTTIMRYTPTSVVNNTPMNSFVFDPAHPDQLLWPAYNFAPPGDVIGIFDNTLAFKGVARVRAVATPPNSATSTLTLDRAIEPALATTGFIAGDLTNSAGARYLIRNNAFLFNRSSALVLQTPYGWVDHNRFVGQSMKAVYGVASQYWGEGPGAEELILSNNLFDGIGHADQFNTLDLLATAANFPNAQDEVIGAGTRAPAINQDIVVAGNRFTADRPAALVNVSSVNNLVFAGNIFTIPDGIDSGKGQRPITVHDASNIFIDESDRFAWHSQSCDGSQLLALSNPPPPVSPITPIACGIRPTVSNFVFEPQ
jgi:hypothetical protein